MRKLLAVFVLERREQALVIVVLLLLLTFTILKHRHDALPLTAPAEAPR